MIRLDELQLTKKINFLEEYIKSYNAADGSKLDANANVSIKNIATLEAEINKDINIQINRKIVFNKIKALYGVDLAQEYIRQIEDHEIYVHDETSLKPYCVSISMYPFLLDGLTKLGGESKAPKNLAAFCGSFINLVFAISSQFAGAIATVEFLTYFDHFARKQYGLNYLKENSDNIKAYFQQVVYSINQPAAARGYQSVFWNISLFDQYYFASMFKDFYFPDGDQPNWETVSELQYFFLEWFNKERTKALLTFPVVTMAMLSDGQNTRDQLWSERVAEQLAKGNSFFIYMSETADSLSSCCRLRNEIQNNAFSYTLGAGGIATGSINVITLNMNRLVQLKNNLADEILKIQKYQMAYRCIMEEFKANGMLNVYDAGFISLDNQYLTIGINGMIEAAESMGICVGNNPEYKEFVSSNLKIIYDLNRQMSEQTGYKFNTEFVPAENLGIKNAQWDKKDGFKVNRECYNSYFYLVEDESTNIVDKFILHGKELTKYLDGGSALHLNIDESLTSFQYLYLLKMAALSGCNYFCINVKVTVCNDCHHIEKRPLDICPICSSHNVDHATRIIGYLKKVSSFSEGRRNEHARRYYHLKDKRTGPNYDVRQPEIVNT